MRKAETYWDFTALSNELPSSATSAERLKLLMKKKMLNRALTALYYKTSPKYRVKCLLNLKDDLIQIIDTDTPSSQITLSNTLQLLLYDAIDISDVSEVSRSLEFMQSVFSLDRAKVCADIWLPKCIDSLIQSGREEELLALIDTVFRYCENYTRYNAFNLYFNDKRHVSAAAMRAYILLHTQNTLALSLEEIETYFPLTHDTVIGFIDSISHLEDKHNVLADVTGELVHQFQFSPSEPRYQAIRVVILHSVLPKQLQYKLVIDKSSIDTLLTTMELFRYEQTSPLNLEQQARIWYDLEDISPEGQTAEATMVNCHRYAALLRNLDEMAAAYYRDFKKRNIEPKIYWHHKLLYATAESYEETVAVKNPMDFLTLVCFYMRIGIPTVQIQIILTELSVKQFGCAALLKELTYWKDTVKQASVTQYLKKISNEKPSSKIYRDFFKCLFHHERTRLTADDYISVMGETVVKHSSEERINLFIDFMMFESIAPVMCFKQVVSGYSATCAVGPKARPRLLPHGLVVRLSNLEAIHADTVCELLQANRGDAIQCDEMDRFIRGMPMGEPHQWQQLFERIEHLTSDNIESYKYILKVLSYLTEKKYQAFMKMLREHPMAYKKLSRLHSIEFRDKGNSDSTWVSNLQRFFRSIPSSLNCEPLRIASTETHIDTAQAFVRIKANAFFERYKDYEVMRVFGRSIEMHHRTDRDNIIVIKVARPKEPLQDLQTEYAMDAKFEGAIQSQIPQPIGLYILNNFWEQLPGSTDITDDQVALLKQQANARAKDVAVFVYKPDVSYLTYTDEITNFADLETSLNKSADDLMSLLIDHRMILPDLISLMHNRDISSGRRDAGRYQAVTFILRQVGSRIGTGRLDQFRHSTSHPNLRASGLADLAKTVSISEVFDWSEGSFVSQYFREAEAMHGSKDKASLAVLTELISEYFLTFSLLIDRWGADHEPNDDFEAKTIDEKWGPYFDFPKRNHWQQVAALKRRVYARMYANLMGIDESEAYTYVESLAKCNRHARQTAYFAASPELDKDCEAKAFSTKLFSRHTEVTFGDARAGTSLITEDGDRHYGHVNGQNPTKEDQRVWTILTDNFIHQTTEQLSEGKTTIFGSDFTNEETDSSWMNFYTY